MASTNATEAESKTVTAKFDSFFKVGKNNYKELESTEELEGEQYIMEVHKLAENCWRKTQTETQPYKGSHPHAAKVSCS